jgi:predicted DNA-binding transcriptional regulator AlpA
MTQTIARRILRTPDAAAYLSLGTPTLEKLRLTGGGPRYVKLGARAIGYDMRDLDAWIDASKVESTSERGT